MRALLLALAGLVASVAPAASATEASPRLVFAQLLTQQDRYSAPPGYLCAADPAGGGQSRASAAGYPFIVQPAYSRDGSHVAYVRGFERGGTIEVANADGSASHAIATGAAAAWPAWFPDGSAVVYEQRVGNAPGFETRLELATLGGPTYDLTSGHHDVAPVVSPDDRHVVFASDRASGNVNALDLFSLDVVTNAIMQLTATPDVSETQPDFSPDGSTLVFAAGPIAAGVTQLATMPVAGGPETALTTASTDGHPRWSPDGSLIAFARGNDVWTVRADGSDARNVTNSPINESDPAWQPVSATPAGGQANCAIVGTPGDDVLVGTQGQDFFYDTDGNDVIYGLGGDDVVYNGPGNDTIHSGDGNDKIYLGPGRNVAYGDAGNDFLNGSATNSPGRTYPPSSSSQRLHGGGGNDTIYGGSGGDVLDGGDDNDLLSAIAGNDILTGGNGSDLLYAGRGDDQLSGGAGNDALWGDSAVGERYAGHDRLTGGTGRDALRGGYGGDLLYAADRARDTVDGGSGTDRGTWDRGLDVVRLVERRSAG